MKIVQLNKTDLSGGAARAAYRLHKGLQKIGYDSTMVVESRTSDDPSVVTFEKPMDAVSLLRRGVRQARIGRARRRYVQSRPKGYELFSDDRAAYGSTLTERIPDCDVVNLHWIPGFVDYGSFFSRMQRKVPIVWTLHDLNAATGGCHYNLGCDRYVTGCGHCPQLGSSNEGDLSQRIWNRKKRVFTELARSRLNIVTPSKWLGDEVQRSPFLRKFPVHVIPYGLDLDAFAPRDRVSARKLLGIAQDARVVLFVAEEVSNTRKGFSDLMAGLVKCAESVPNLLLLSLGQNPTKIDAPIPWMHIGSVNNDRFLSIVYSAADIFVITSLQDNLPNTVLEAMACGAAVVGYDAGGIPDMVRTGTTGLTVPTRDVDGLAAAIAELLNEPRRCHEMGMTARAIAINDYALEVQARRYAELYASLT